MTKGLSPAPSLASPRAVQLQPGTGTGRSQGSQHTHKTSLQSQLHVLLTNQFGNLLVINPAYQFLSLFLNVIKLLIYMFPPLPKAKHRAGSEGGREMPGGSTGP